MKLRLLIFVSFLAGLLATISAHAATVNLTGSTYAFANPVVAGQSGSITTSRKNSGSSKLYAYAEGLLAPYTEVAFTFTAKKDSGYTFVKSSVPFDDSMIKANSKSQPSATSWNDLVQVTACFQNCTGTTTIRNMSSEAVNFFTYLVDKAGNQVTATYIAYAIPLPPALLLFGFGFAAFAGISRLKSAPKA